MTPAEYRRLAISEAVEVCSGIELRYDWIRFLEVGTEGDHVHHLIQGTPEHSPSSIITAVESIMAKRVSAEHSEVRRMLWGGSFWNSGYSGSSVGRYTSKTVEARYVRNQCKEKDYQQLYLNLDME